MSRIKAVYRWVGDKYKYAVVFAVGAYTNHLLTGSHEQRMPVALDVALWVVVGALAVIAVWMLVATHRLIKSLKAERDRLQREQT